MNGVVNMSISKRSKTTNFKIIAIKTYRCAYARIRIKGHSRSNEDPLCIKKIVY